MLGEVRVVPEGRMVTREGAQRGGRIVDVYPDELVEDLAALRYVLDQQHRVLRLGVVGGVVARRMTNRRAFDSAGGRLRRTC